MFYTEGFFKISDEVETDQKIVKIPVIIVEEQDDTHSNITHIPVKAITQFDNNTEEVLVLVSIVNDQEIKSKNIVTAGENLKSLLHYLSFVSVDIYSLMGMIWS